MKTRKAHVMWAIMNYDSVMSVHHRRGEARKAGGEMMPGGEAAWKRYVREGSLRIAKVHVIEAKP